MFGWFKKNAPPVSDRREELPKRRQSETIKFEHSNFKWHATFGFYDDGRLGEVFLSTAKAGEMGRHLANDAAISASLALQYGCPLEKLMEALCRDSAGEPQTPLAIALSKGMKKEEEEEKAT